MFDLKFIVKVCNSSRLPYDMACTLLRACTPIQAAFTHPSTMQSPIHRENMCFTLPCLVRDLGSLYFRLAHLQPRAKGIHMAVCSSNCEDLYNNSALMLQAKSIGPA